MEQREQCRNAFEHCRVVIEEGEAKSQKEQKELYAMKGAIMKEAFCLGI